MLIYVRHGDTAFNAGGTEERLRGWLPVPLTPKGEQSANRAGQRLRGLEPNTFATSDLHRAAQSAHIIGQQIGQPPDPDPALRDWNTGDLAGRKFEDVKETIFHLIDHPDKSAPGGESINEYLTRFIPAMRTKVEDPGVHLVVGHARGGMVLQGIASPEGGVGQDLDKQFLKTRPNFSPGDMLTFQPTWKMKVLNGHQDQEQT